MQSQSGLPSDTELSKGGTFEAEVSVFVEDDGTNSPEYASLLNELVYPERFTRHVNNALKTRGQEQRIAITKVHLLNMSGHFDDPFPGRFPTAYLTAYGNKVVEIKLKIKGECTKNLAPLLVYGLIAVISAGIGYAAGTSSTFLEFIKNIKVAILEIVTAAGEVAAAAVGSATTAIMGPVLIGAAILLLAIFVAGKSGIGSKISVS